MKSKMSLIIRDDGSSSTFKRTQIMVQMNPHLVTVGKTVHIGFGISVLENWS